MHTRNLLIKHVDWVGLESQYVLMSFRRVNLPGSTLFCS